MYEIIAIVYPIRPTKTSLQCQIIEMTVSGHMLYVRRRSLAFSRLPVLPASVVRYRHSPDFGGEGRNGNAPSWIGVNRSVVFAGMQLYL